MQEENKFSRQVLSGLGATEDLAAVGPVLSAEAASLAAAREPGPGTWWPTEAGYNSDLLGAVLAARGVCAVIPPRRKRRQPRPYYAARHAQRRPVERLFRRLKQFAAWPRATTSWRPIF